MVQIPPHIAADIARARVVCIVVEIGDNPQNKQMNFAFLGCDLPYGLGLLEQAKFGACYQGIRGSVLDVRDKTDPRSKFEVRR